MRRSILGALALAAAGAASAGAIAAPTLASIVIDNLANAHPLMAPFHVGQRNTNPLDSDPRYFVQTFTPRTIGVNVTANF